MFRSPLSLQFRFAVRTVAKATEYLPAAQSEALPQFRAYTPSIRFFERGIALALDEGEFEQAIVLCNAALALNMGNAYAAKKASIERML